MLRWLSRLALCSMLCHCGSSDSEGLFDSEAGAGAPRSMAPAPDFAGSVSGAAPSSGPAAGATAAGATAARDAAEALDEASAPASPMPAVPLPEEASDADAPGANEPAPAPSSPAGEPRAPGVPDAVSVIQIERARWDEDDGELEVRGVVSSPEVTLSVQFLGRAEPLLNEAGSFRGEFSAVEDDPEQVTVTASDGASATARVEVD